MVSLLSLFGRKKAKRATSPSREGSKEAAGVQRGPSPTPKDKHTRFLSLRSRSSSKPYDLAARRASTELTRRRSNTRRVSAKPSREEEQVPKLALGWELQSVDGLAADGDTLGLRDVGKPPKLNAEELEFLRKQQFSLEQLLLGWKVLGEALRKNDLGQAGLMVVRPSPSDAESQDLLIALILLSARPDLSAKFKTLVDHYGTTPGPTSSTENSSTMWTQHLDSLCQDQTDACVLCEALKYLLRHLNQSSSNSMLENSTHSTSASILDSATYITFLRAERDNNFPVDAYHFLLSSRLPVQTGRILEEVFDLWSAVASKSDSNGMSGGKISRLLGWWIFEKVIPERHQQDWTELYDQWAVNGRRTEHLFYAWIRHQATRQQLPARLLRLVEDYPFGDISEESTLLPSPPPSSFLCQVLQISLVYTGRQLPTVTPRELLHLAASSKPANNTGVWTEWLKSKGSAFIEEMLVDDDRVYQERFDSRFEALLEPPSSASPSSVSSDSAAGGPLYRPFSILSTTDLSHTLQDPIQRPRSRSHGNLLHEKPVMGTDSILPQLGPVIDISSKTVNRRPSHDVLSTNSGQPDIWTSFEKTGFGESPEAQLRLAPRVPTSGVDFRLPVSTASRNSSRRESSKYAMTGEDIVSVDHLFFNFIQDGQLDAHTSRHWPKLACARLRSPISRPDCEPVEYIMVTLSHVPEVEPTAIPSPRESASDVPRSSSPAASTTSRSGQNFQLFRRSPSFKSPSSTQTSRRSFFGGSSRTLSKNADFGDQLPILEESSSTKPNIHLNPPTVAGEANAASNNDSTTAEPKTPKTALSTVPTEYTVSELGEMVKVPISAADGYQERLDPSRDTKPSEWAYRAEGGAHLILAYTGSSPTYTRRVLRIRKGTEAARDESSTSLTKSWKEELLPKLLPAEYLLSTVPVTLEADWTKTLFGKVEKLRPKERISKSGSLVDSIGSFVVATVMDDTIAATTIKGEGVLCLEIKPKWGFLPDHSNVQPAEAAAIKSTISRYRLHHHLKATGSVTETDGYDPVDLFSGDEIRVGKAIDDLWSIWMETKGKKNNWRVYVDGKVVLPDQVGKVPTTKKDGSLGERTGPLIAPILLSSSILPELKRLQSTLDPLDISTLATRYNSENPDVEVFDPEQTPESTLEELRQVVQHCSDGADFSKLTLRECMIAYTLSATFKDCSIFVRIPVVQSKSGLWMRKGSGEQVKVIDLDLKSVKSLKKWYELDEEIWRHWHATHPTTVKHDESTPPSSEAVVPTNEPIATTLPEVADRSITPTPADQSVGETAVISTLPEEPSLPVHLSLEDALGSSPSKSTFGRRDSNDVVSDDHLGDGHVSLADALALTPVKPIFPPNSNDRDISGETAVNIIEHDSAQHTNGPSTHEIPVLEELSQYEDHVLSDVEEEDGMEHDGVSSASPRSTRRIKRSSAPSPSPLLGETMPDLPPELQELLNRSQKHTPAVLPLEVDAPAAKVTVPDQGPRSAVHDAVVEQQVEEERREPQHSPEVAEYHAQPTVAALPEVVRHDNAEAKPSQTEVGRVESSEPVPTIQSARPGPASPEVDQREAEVSQVASAPLEPSQAETPHLEPAQPGSSSPVPAQATPAVSPPVQSEIAERSATGDEAEIAQAESDPAQAVSGSSTPFEDYSTPMAEIAGPVVVNPLELSMAEVESGDREDEVEELVAEESLASSPKVEHEPESEAAPQMESAPATSAEDIGQPTPEPIAIMEPEASPRLVEQTPGVEQVSDEEAELKHASGPSIGTSPIDMPVQVSEEETTSQVPAGEIMVVASDDEVESTENLEVTAPSVPRGDDTVESRPVHSTASDVGVVSTHAPSPVMPTGTTEYASNDETLDSTADDTFGPRDLTSDEVESEVPTAADETTSSIPILPSLSVATVVDTVTSAAHAWAEAIGESVGAASPAAGAADETRSVAAEKPADGEAEVSVKLDDESAAGVEELDTTDSTKLDLQAEVAQIGIVQSTPSVIVDLDEMPKASAGVHSKMESVSHRSIDDHVDEEEAGHHGDIPTVPQTDVNEIVEPGVVSESGIPNSISSRTFGEGGQADQPAEKASAVSDPAVVELLAGEPMESMESERVHQLAHDHLPDSASKDLEVSATGTKDDVVNPPTTSDFRSGLGNKLGEVDGDEG